MEGYSVSQHEDRGKEIVQTTKTTIFQKILSNGELIAAIISGILILVGALLAKNNWETLSVITYLCAFVIGGFAKAREGITETINDKQLNVELLMILAAIGSAIIGYWAEGAILIFIFSLSGALETYTMNKSNEELSALLKLQPEEALRINNGVEEVVHVSELVIGDQLLVKPGERIPTDGEILSGQTTIDQAAITGESMPVSKQIADEVFAGTVNLTGSINMTVTKSSSETLFNKIIELVQSAQSEKSPSQQFIERFEGTYVKVVLTVVAIMMVLPHYALGWSWTDTFYRAMILLVVASPCALMAAIMPATLAAISNGAKNGILFKGGVHLENLSNVTAVAFDKTGTLTKGTPEVTDFIVINEDEREDIIRTVAAIENHSNHPLAQAIVKYYHSNFQTDKEVIIAGIEDVVGYGVKATVEGEEWKIGNARFVGLKAAEFFNNNSASKLAAEGKTTVFVAKNDEINAILALQDVVRDETKLAISKLKEAGVFSLMLTGDSKETGAAIAKEANVDNFVAECLPEHKVTELKKLIDSYGTVAMVGDGINDAPALATAHVGIAMGEGTDVALETADVVLMKNDLSRIAEAIKLSQKMNKIVKQNIVFSISVIALLIISNFLQFLNLPAGVIAHEGSTILVILNGLRLLRKTTN